jgi:hypothetical protein
VASVGYVALHAAVGAQAQLAPHPAVIPPAPAGYEAISFRTSDGLRTVVVAGVECLGELDHRGLRFRRGLCAAARSHSKAGEQQHQPRA